jgi:ATP-dependent Clp protease protease subunit
MRKTLNQIYVDHTHQKLEDIERFMERDHFMSAEEALAFGLVDHVLTKRKPLSLRETFSPQLN